MRQEGESRKLISTSRVEEPYIFSLLAVDHYAAGMPSPCLEGDKMQWLRGLHPPPPCVHRFMQARHALIFGFFSRIVPHSFLR